MLHDLAAYVDGFYDQRGTTLNFICKYMISLSKMQKAVFISREFMEMEP